MDKHGPSYERVCLCLSRPGFVSYVDRSGSWLSRWDPVLAHLRIEPDISGQTVSGLSFYSHISLVHWSRGEVDQNLLDRAQVSFRAGHINMHSGIQILHCWIKYNYCEACITLWKKKPAKKAGIELVEVHCVSVCTQVQYLWAILRHWCFTWIVQVSPTSYFHSSKYYTFYSTTCIWWL